MIRTLVEASGSGMGMKMSDGVFTIACYLCDYGKLAGTTYDREIKPGQIAFRFSRIKLQKRGIVLKVQVG